MSVEDWIDDVAAIWGTMVSAKRGNVRSYRCFTKEEFPEAITEYPSAISFVTRLRFSGGGDSSPHVMLWDGMTEIYVSPGVSKVGAPEVMRYFERALRAALKNRTLNGKVAEFSLIKKDEGEAIVGPAVLSYSGEAGSGSLGLVVHWRVKEILSGVTLG
jgi:hypothetical protein